MTENYPDHGLLWVRGRSVFRVKDAAVREDVDLYSEIRLLQFALVHVRQNLAARGPVDLNALVLQPLPASLDAERAVLGAILLSILLDVSKDGLQTRPYEAIERCLDAGR